MAFRKPLSLFAALGILIASAFPSFSQSVTLEDSSTPQFSEEKPDYLHFKKVVVTREGKNKYNFDITLKGKIKSNTKDKIYYYVGFDIDDDAATGTTAAHSPKFGQDIWIFITKPVGTNRFEENSSSVMFRGKVQELKLSGLKMNDDKINFDLRSELFGFNDKFKFFVSATRLGYERDKVVSDQQVDVLSSNGPVTFGDVEKK